MSDGLTKEDLKAMKYAAENAFFGELYSHEVRHGSGVVDWDLSTCESDDPDADGESIARVYNIRDVRYFVEVTPERVAALIADNERLRAELAEEVDGLCSVIESFVDDDDLMHPDTSAYWAALVAQKRKRYGIGQDGE